MAFLSSRGLCCCEGFEPQPPKRLEMRRLILGCRSTRADACGREAIEPLIKTLTFHLPIEAKIIPSPRPKTSAETFPLRRFCLCCGLPAPLMFLLQARSLSGLPQKGAALLREKEEQAMQPRRETHSGGHAGFVPTRFGTRGRGSCRRLDQKLRRDFSLRSFCLCCGLPAPLAFLLQARSLSGLPRRSTRKYAGKQAPPYSG